MRSGPGGPDQLRSLPPQQGQAVFWRVEHWFAPGRREMVSERQEIKGRIFGPWSRGFSDASFFSFWRPLKSAQRRYPRKHTLSHTHTNKPTQGTAISFASSGAGAAGRGGLRHQARDFANRNASQVFHGWKPYRYQLQNRPLPYFRKRRLRLSQFL